MKKNVKSFNGAAIDAAKVANVEYRYYKYGTKGYLLDNGTLVAVTVAVVLVDLRNQLVKSVLKDVSGKEYNREGEYELYEDNTAFNEGNRKKRVVASTEFLLKCGETGVLRDCKTYTCDVDEEKHTSNIYVTVWVMENGNPVEVPVVINSVANNGAWAVSNGSLPDMYWSSHKKTVDNNEYKIVDEDGDEFVEKGTQLRLTPTKEQLDALYQLDKAFKAANDAGLVFVWDREMCGMVKAYNGNEVTQMRCNLLPSDGGGTVIPIHDVDFVSTNISFYDYLGYDCEDKLELKPTPRQLKQWKKEHPDATI